MLNSTGGRGGGEYSTLFWYSVLPKGPKMGAGLVERIAPNLGDINHGNAAYRTDFDNTAAYRTDFWPKLGFLN